MPHATYVSHVQRLVEWFRTSNFILPDWDSVTFPVILSLNLRPILPWFARESAVFNRQQPVIPGILVPHVMRRRTATKCSRCATPAWPHRDASSIAAANSSRPGRPQAHKPPPIETRGVRGNATSSSPVLCSVICIPFGVDHSWKWEAVGLLVG